MTYIDPPHKLFAHLDRIADIREGGHPAPVNVEIDLSNRCNLGCTGCHFAHTHTRGPLASHRTVEVGDLMPGYLAFVILQQLQEAGVRSVTWTGGGEPTLHPDFDRIISLCPLPQGLYTNATMITPERAALIREKMTWVVCSIDYQYLTDYEINKGKFYWDMMAGVASLCQAKGQATIGLSFLLGKHNSTQADIDAALEMGREARADYVQFRPLILFDQAHPDKPNEDTTWMDELIGRLKGLNHGTEIDVSRFEMYRNWTGHGYPTCYWAQMQTVITPDGRVWGCVNRRGHAGSLLGDLTHEDFSGIWAGSHAWAVDHDCRVLCRGHIPNLSLAEMMTRRNHEEWI